MLISVTPSQIDLFHILFGNVLGVSDSDIVQVARAGGARLRGALLKRRDLVLYAFDPTHAHAIGISPRRLGALLLGLLALTVVVALQAVGIVLVVAMLITPGATAYLLTDRFDRMLVIAPVHLRGLLRAGTYLSYYLDTSTGGLVVLTQAAVFAVVYLFGPRHGLIGTRLAMSRRRKAAGARRLTVSARSLRPGPPPAAAARRPCPTAVEAGQSGPAVSYLTTQAAAGQARHLPARTP